MILAKNSGEVDAFTVPRIKPDQSKTGFKGLFGTKSDNESCSKDNPDGDPNNSPFSNSEMNSDFKGNKPESKEYEHLMYQKHLIRIQILKQMMNLNALLMKLRLP